MPKKPGRYPAGFSPSDGVRFMDGLAALVLALRETVFTVNGSVLPRLERDFALFVAFRAGCLKHLLRSAKSSTTLITHVISFVL